MALGVGGLRTSTKARVAGVGVAVAIAAPFGVAAASARNDHPDRSLATRGAILYQGPLPDLTDAVIVANADGSGAKWIAKNACCGSWSPDGRFIAFQKYVGERWQLWVMKASGGPPHFVTKDAVGYSWAPDGHAFAYRHANGKQIGRVNVDGSARTFVTSGPADYAPAWSPDGRTIGYIGGAFTKRTLKAVDPDGGHERVLADDAFDPFAWSPDGGRIAFNRAYEYPLHEVQLVNVDGSQRRTVFTLRKGLDDPELAWSPDGSRLALGLGMSLGRPRFIIVRLDGTVERTIDGVGETPAWSPSSTGIAGVRRAVPWVRAGRKPGDDLLRWLDGQDVSVVDLLTNRRWRVTGSWALGVYENPQWDPLGRPTTSLGGNPVGHRLPQRWRTTFVFTGRRTLAYVRRSRGRWVDANACVIQRAPGGRLVAYAYGGVHDEVLGKIGSARPSGTGRWDVIDPDTARRLGFVSPRQRRTWAIGDSRGRIVATARGADGPAAALDVLTELPNSECVSAAH